MAVRQRVARVQRVLKRGPKAWQISAQLGKTAAPYTGMVQAPAKGLDVATDALDRKLVQHILVGDQLGQLWQLLKTGPGSIGSFGSDRKPPMGKPLPMSKNLKPQHPKPKQQMQIRVSQKVHAALVSVVFSLGKTWAME